MQYFKTYHQFARPVREAVSTAVVDLKMKYGEVLKRLAGTKKVPTLNATDAERVSEDARLVQDFLLKKKLGQFRADGRFGKLSAAAVKQYQGTVKLPTTGIVDVKTWGAILGELGMDTSNLSTADALDAATVQERLVDLPRQYASFFKKIGSEKMLPEMSVALAAKKLDYVELFQKYLDLKGVPNAPVPNGMFTEASKHATLAFQKQYGLPETGIVELKTWQVVCRDLQVETDGFSLRPIHGTQSAEEKGAGKGLYTYSDSDKRLFVNSTFRDANGAKVKGEALLRGNQLTGVDFPRIIAANSSMRNVLLLLLKQSKALGANPTQLVMQDRSLGHETMKSLLKLYNQQLDGELLYYGLRGAGAEKGRANSPRIQTLLKQRKHAPDLQKVEIRQWFDRCNANAHDAYSDIQAQPLRKWLYDEFQDKEDPAKWMNMLTPADPESDKRLYPKLNVPV